MSVSVFPSLSMPTLEHTVCAGCGRGRSDAWVEITMGAEPTKGFAYCRHCFVAGYEAHRRTYEAQWGRAQVLPDGMPARSASASLGATRRWIAGSGCLPRIARYIFP